MSITHAERAIVPSRTYLYLAELGTVAPTDATAVLDDDWKCVGHTTKDSLSFSTDPSFEPVESAQSDYEIRNVQTGDAASVQVDLIEFSATNFKAVYGGGTIVQLSAADTTTTPAKPAQFKFVPPRIGGRKDLSAIVEVVDGDKHYRYVFPRVSQNEGVEAQLHKGTNTTLPLRLKVLGADAADAWYVLSDDPALDPTL